MTKGSEQSEARIVGILKNIERLLKALISSQAAPSPRRDWVRHPLGHNCPRCNRHRIKVSLKA